MAKTEKESTLPAREKLCEILKKDKLSDKDKLALLEDIYVWIKPLVKQLSKYSFFHEYKLDALRRIMTDFGGQVPAEAEARSDDAEE